MFRLRSCRKNPAHAQFVNKVDLTRFTIWNHCNDCIGVKWTDLSLVLISGYIHTVCFPLSRVSCRSGCLYHSAPAWSWKLTAQTRWSMKSGNPPPGHTRHSWGEQPDTAYMCWPLWWCTHLNLEPRTAINATMCNYSHSNIIWERLMATFLFLQVKLWRGFQRTKQHEMTI